MICICKQVVIVEPGPVNTPMATNQPTLGLDWCAAHPTSLFAPAMKRSCETNDYAMRVLGFSPSSFRVGYTAQEVAAICISALSAEEPRARYLACRGPFLLLLWLVRMLPEELGDAIMARV